MARGDDLRVTYVSLFVSYQDWCLGGVNVNEEQIRGFFGPVLCSKDLKLRAALRRKSLNEWRHDVFCCRTMDGRKLNRIIGNIHLVPSKIIIRYSG